MRQIEIACFILLFICGCAITPNLSAPQRRALQTRTFEKITYDGVFKAFKTVLQDEGYIIQNQDYKGGMILASVQKKYPSFPTIYFKDADYPIGEGFEVSISLDEINQKKGIVETRLTIQKMEYFKKGTKQGSEVVNEETYKNIYDKLLIEIERRKAMGRG